MSDDLSLLMMQLPQKSRLVHSDGRRGEIKFLWELGNQKTKITGSSPVPDICQDMLIYTTWQEPPAHSIKTVSTGEQQAALILVIGWVQILLRSQTWQHTNMSTRVCFLHSTQNMVKKISSCSSCWDIPITKLRLVNGCSDNPKPLLFIRTLRTSVLRSPVAVWSHLRNPRLQSSAPTPLNVVTWWDARIFSKHHPSDVFESNAAMLTKVSSMTVWNHLGRDPSPSPSRLWHKSPCSCFGAEKNRFILARLPIFSRRLPVGRPWYYYSVSTLVVACAKQEMIIGVSAQHSLIPASTAHWPKWSLSWPK